MEQLIHNVKRYMFEALDIPVAPRPWEKARELPRYLRDQYRFYEAEVLGDDCVLVADVSEHEQTPVTIGKHLNQIRARHGGDVIYVRDALAPHNRKRLVQHKIPFIVPCNQMYLPDLGVDLHEHFSRLRSKRTSFRPATQALLLYAIWNGRDSVLTPSLVASQLEYSLMTMTRAFDELESAGIGEHETKGRERRLRFAGPSESLWKAALPFLNTPVKRRVYAELLGPLRLGRIAGESALSRYTMLAEPVVPVLAVSGGEWMEHTERGQLRTVPYPENGAFQIEIWKYDPGAFKQDVCVDHLSLYLSLRDTANERVQSALSDLMREMEW